MLMPKGVTMVQTLQRWIEDVEVGYGQDAKTAICAQVVPLLQTFYSIIHPTTVTYSGKLNKAYQLLAAISTETAPYENVLKEVSASMDELNIALRNLNASIGIFIDRMTQHKTPQEVLDLFEKYEEEVVVAAYQRFKTTTENRCWKVWTSVRITILTHW